MTLFLLALNLYSVVKQRFDGRIIYFPNWADKVIEDNLINDRVASQ